MHPLLKVVITALLVTAISQVSKWHIWLGAILASLPITSVLAMIWLYSDTHDVKKVSALSTSIFWAVLPSLLFFLVLPRLLATGMRFAPAMICSCAVMAAGYLAYSAAYSAMMSRFGSSI